MDEPDSPSAQVLRLLTGGWLARAVEAVAAVGVADVLADGALPATELGARTGTDPDALHRVLRALVPAGLVTSSGNGYALTAAGACLRSDQPGSVRPFAVMRGSEPVQRSWEATSRSAAENEAIPATVDLTGVGRIVDVGPLGWSSRPATSPRQYRATVISTCWRRCCTTGATIRRRPSSGRAARRCPSTGGS